MQHRPEAKTEVIFQAKTQAKIFLLNWAQELSFFTNECQAHRLPCACSMHLMTPKIDAGDLLSVHVFDTRPTSCLGFKTVLVAAADIALLTISGLSPESISESRSPQAPNGRIFMRRDTLERIGEVARRGALLPSAFEVLAAVRDVILTRFKAVPRKTTKLTRSELGKSWASSDCDGVVQVPGRSPPPRRGRLRHPGGQ